SVRPFRGFFRVESRLINPNKPPLLLCSFGDPGAPEPYGLIFQFGTLPNTALRLDDRVDLALCGFLNDNPIRMVIADRAARLQVIHSKSCTRLTLFRCSETGEAQDIGRLVGELRESPFEAVVRRHVIEDRALAHKR